MLKIDASGLGPLVFKNPLRVPARGSAKLQGWPLERAGFDLWNRLRIDNRTMVSDVTHRIRDLAREATRSKPIGSTGRGIAPGYEDRGDKSHITFGDFLGSREAFTQKILERVQRCCDRVRYEYGLTEKQWDKIFSNDPSPGSSENPGLTQRELRANRDAISDGIFLPTEFDFLRYKGNEPFTLLGDLIAKEYWHAGQMLIANIVDVGELTLKILDRSPRHVIYEHGQAIGLDVIHGDTPNTTSSNTTSSDVPYSGKTRVTQGLHVVMVAKAYETAVGTHTLLTPMGVDHPLAKLLMPEEKGVTTGRQRDVCWPCAVQMGDALRWHGAHDLMVNKIDKLTLAGDWQGPLKICVGYKTPQGETIYKIPDNSAQRRSLSPIYRELPGWTEDISSVREFSDLPFNAQVFIATLYAECLKVANHGLQNLKQFPRLQFIGVGPKQDQVIRHVPLPEQLLRLASNTAE